ERKVRAPQKGLAAASIERSDGYADAGRRHDLVPIDVHRLGHRLEDLTGEPFGVISLVADDLQDDKLVAAEPADKLPPRRLLQAAGRLHEQCVAGGVAKRVVDDLELVEIQAMQREQLTVTFLRAEELLERLLEHRPVRKTRQRI